MTKDKSPPALQEWNTVKDAALILRTTRQTLTKRIKEGTLPAIDLGTDARSSYRVSAATIQDMLERSKS